MSEIESSSAARRPTAEILPRHPDREIAELLAMAVLRMRGRHESVVRDPSEVTYRVAALDDGRFELEGRPYKSLSAVARVITGSSYSGPVFFGLKPCHRDRQRGQA